jgi:hypothetical protein
MVLMKEKSDDGLSTKMKSVYVEKIACVLCEVVF